MSTRERFELARPPRDMALVAAREVMVTVRSAMWPFARLNPMPPPGNAEGRHPVVLVHGYMGHPDMLRPLARRLLEDGWAEVHRLGYPSMRWHMEQIIDEVASTTMRLARRHGTKVDLVGHSLGAVACRAWVKLYGGDAWVRRFVSLGGPHAGTSLYRMVPSPVRTVFDPRGPWVKRLADGPETVPTTVVRARYDHQVLPPHRASIPGIDEHVVDAHGHNGLLWSPDAHDQVVEALLAEPVPQARMS